MKAHDLRELETPCLILELSRMDANIETMRQRMKRFGVPLRPHVKTPKSIDVVRRVLDDRTTGITVSTLKEAEYFFRNGIRDILYAVGIAPGKLEHVGKLRKQGADVAIILDTVEQAELAAARGKEMGITIPCLIEIDSDGHRSGVKPSDPLLVDIARRLHILDGVECRGVITHAGESYHCKTTDEIRIMAERERRAAVDGATRLKDLGLPCPIVSIGSTPTATFGEHFDGVTEVRAGVYVFQDLVMVGLGVCLTHDIAISVLASVIGCQKDKGWLITDAGWMALSRDRGTAGQTVDQGYGLVCDAFGQPIEDLIVAMTNQEHGILIDRRGRLNFERFPIGTQLRILPNHACATAAMFDRYYVVDGSMRIIDMWMRFGGWE
jgi:D-serine deaminase-like pyridoxal phosphate-dependent protein